MVVFGGWPCVLTFGPVCCLVLCPSGACFAHLQNVPACMFQQCKKTLNIFSIYVCIYIYIYATLRCTLTIVIVTRTRVLGMCGPWPCGGWLWLFGHKGFLCLGCGWTSSLPAVDRHALDLLHTIPKIVVPPLPIMKHDTFCSAHADMYGNT